MCLLISGPSTVVLRLFLYISPVRSITVATVMLRALDKVRGRVLDLLGSGIGRTRSTSSKKRSDVQSIEACPTSELLLWRFPHMPRIHSRSVGPQTAPYDADVEKDGRLTASGDNRGVRGTSTARFRAAVYKNSWAVSRPFLSGSRVWRADVQRTSDALHSLTSARPTCFIYIYFNRPMHVGA